MPNRTLVVDANILVRAVLGKRVRAVMEAHAGTVSFFTPEIAYCEAEDTDFFGCGVATWTSNRVQMFLTRKGPPVPDQEEAPEEG